MDIFDAKLDALQAAIHSQIDRKRHDLDETFVIKDLMDFSSKVYMQVAATNQRMIEMAMGIPLELCNVK